MLRTPFALTAAAWLTALFSPPLAYADDSKVPGSETQGGTPTTASATETGLRWPLTRAKSLEISPGTAPWKVDVSQGKTPLNVGISSWPLQGHSADAPLWVNVPPGAVQPTVKALEDIAKAMRAMPRCTPQAPRDPACDGIALMRADVEMLRRTYCDATCIARIDGLRKEIDALKQAELPASGADTAASVHLEWHHEAATTEFARTIETLGGNLKRLVDHVTEEEPGVETQLAANEDLLRRFPNASSITTTLAIVPDKRVPRHRRAFELSVQAISSGMHANRFQLYAHDLSGAQGQTLPVKPLRQRFGLLLYRNDAWRHGVCATRNTDSPPGNDCGETFGEHLWAVYVVPETATLGVDPVSFDAAVAHVSNMRSSPTGGRIQNAVHPDCGHMPDGPAGSMLAWGPTFSGSMASARDALLRNPAMGSLCLLSATTTVESNSRILEECRDGDSHDKERTGTASPNPVSETCRTERTLIPRTLAQYDNKKLRTLERILDRNGVRHDQVAFLSEASTFGSELCPPTGAVKLCGLALQVPFRANIADIRHGRAQQLAERRARMSSSMPDFTGLSSNLKIQDGAENGSEYPESEQSPLTRNGAELEMNGIIKQLRRRNVRAVVVGATEIRDRLFLFDALRRSLPDALFVDLEADSLLSHPDVIHATRGVPLMWSQRLEPLDSDNLIDVFQTDRQALLHDAVKSSVEATSGKQSTPASIVGKRVDSIGVATRQGLVATESGMGLAAGTFWILLLVASLAMACRVVGLAASVGARWPALAFRLGGLALILAIPVSWISSCDVLYPMLVVLPGLWLMKKVLETADASRNAVGIRFTGPESITTSHLAYLAGVATLALGGAFSLDQLFAESGHERAPTIPLRILLDAGSGIATALAIIAIVIALPLLVAWLGTVLGEQRFHGAVISRAIERMRYRELREIALRYRPDLAVPSEGIPLAAILLVLFLSHKPSLSGTLGSAALLAAALLMLALGLIALNAARRELRMCSALGRVLLARSQRANEDDETLERNLLSAITGTVPPSATPVAVQSSSIGELAEHPSNPVEWSRLIRGALSETPDERKIGALISVLGFSITRMRALLGVAVTCGLLVIVMAWLTPYTRHDDAAIAASSLILLAALSSGYSAHALEHDAILRVLLCQRKTPTLWSGWLFAMVGLPLLALTAALLLLQNPGVLQSAGGIVGYLLSLWRGFP